MILFFDEMSSPSFIVFVKHCLFVFFVSVGHCASLFIMIWVIHFCNIAEVATSVVHTNISFFSVQSLSIWYFDGFVPHFRIILSSRSVMTFVEFFV